jgi:hypothetical protein
MKRLGRRASLLVAFSLLTSAAAAHAECAWVLWTSLGDQSSQPGRAVLSAFPNAQECHAALGTLVEGMKQKHRTETWISSPKGSGWYNEPKRGRVVLNCLPDTVDPRGPKAK